ncbi:hypothetical protein RCL1_005480 [Eukaryota sp. TZLM3-RCL]
MTSDSADDLPLLPTDPLAQEPPQGFSLHNSRGNSHPAWTLVWERNYNSCGDLVCRGCYYEESRTSITRMQHHLKSCSKLQETVELKTLLSYLVRNQKSQESYHVARKDTETNVHKITSPPIKTMQQPLLKQSISDQAILDHLDNTIVHAIVCLGFALSTLDNPIFVNMIKLIIKYAHSKQIPTDYSPPSRRRSTRDILPKLIHWVTLDGARVNISSRNVLRFQGVLGCTCFAHSVSLTLKNMLKLK